MNTKRFILAGCAIIILSAGSSTVNPSAPSTEAVRYFGSTCRAPAIGGARTSTEGEVL
jgi:hypothetical protein